MMHPPAMAAPSTAATTGRGNPNRATNARCSDGISRAAYVPSAVDDPGQIDAGGEHATVAGQDDGPHAVVETAERRREGVEHLDVEGVDLAVLQPHHDDVVRHHFDRDHPATEPDRR